MALSRDASDEAVYPRIYVDRNRGALDGSARYRIAGDLDMNASWWSVTLVDEEFDPICHQAERHSFTSFNVVPTADGCRFVIDIAPDSPPGATN